MVKCSGALDQWQQNCNLEAEPFGSQYQASVHVSLTK